MRAVIRSKLSAGESDQQILDEFVGSYGDGILTEPPKRGVGLGVWLGPVVGVVFGALVLGVLVTSWHRPRVRSPELAVQDPEVAAELHQFRQQVGR
jgi:cytochrome c-type biogenesis protein CcmH